MTTQEEHRESKNHIGTHVVADFWDCEFDGDSETLRHLLINAAHVSNARILDSSAHQFEPTGATALLLLAESHISAHTWPEYGYIAVDIFTCGQNMKPAVAIEYLKSAFKPKSVDIQTIKRGKRSND